MLGTVLEAGGAPPSMYVGFVCFTTVFHYDALCDVQSVSTVIRWDASESFVTCDNTTTTTTTNNNNIIININIINNNIIYWRSRVGWCPDNDLSCMFYYVSAGSCPACTPRASLWAPSTRVGRP